MLLGCEVLTKKGLQRNSNGKLSHSRYAALLYLCIKK